MSKTVLSYFATGSQGGSMARAFAQSGFNVRTITRDLSSDAAKSLMDEGIQVLRGDLADREALKAANKGVDVVALIVPFFHPQSEMYMQNAVDAAKETGVELVVFNASSPLPEKPVGDPSVDHRMNLQQILEGSGLPYITIALGSYMENLLGPWTAQPIRAGNILSYPIPDGKGFSWIATKDVGALMVEAAKRPELANSIVRISGPENLTGPEMAASFSRALNRDIQWQYISPRELGDRCAAVIGKVAGDGLAQYYAIVEHNMEQVVPFYNMQPILEKLPVRLTTLEEWVREHAFLFQSE
jgi:uncharacterized protein YbjT (DUF2867 family)